MKYLLGFILFTIQQLWAVSLKDDKYYHYDVFFTNPICKTYQLQTKVYSNNGDPILTKPKNVYCKYHDARKNQKRQDSPHYNLVKLINDPDLKELKMAYLSFSNADIINQICNVVTKKNVRFTLFVDKKNTRKVDKMRKLRKLMSCRPEQKFSEVGVANYPKIKFRGHTGKIGFAHNKIIVASFKSEPRKRVIVFSSGNMSSGTTLHHENWHFVTVSRESYFAQIHDCLLEGMDNHAKSIRRRGDKKKKSAKDVFASFIKTCRANINAEEEKDIKVYIVPGEGNLAMENIIDKINKSKKIAVAAHRFTHFGLLTALKRASHNTKQDVRFVGDDDIYWAGMLNYMPSKNRVVCSSKHNPNVVRTVGANMCNEYFNVRDLERAGAKVKYMQTNQKMFLLHHNKYVLFNLEDGSRGLHCGAGNFTKAAFDKNFENYYYITIPEVIDRFQQQYQYVWDDLATSKGDLPQNDISNL